MKTTTKSGAALCVALFLSPFTLATETMIRHQGLLIECVPQGNLVSLNIKSEDSNARLKIASAGGNQFSSTIQKGSLLKYQLDTGQFPLTLSYIYAGKESELQIQADCQQGENKSPV